jgi:transcriptional regulator with XRE-family HTH domain
LKSLRYIREQAGYSQQDLADESGVSQHTISEIELGRRKPQGRTLRKLAQVLGVRVADLYVETEAPKVSGPLHPQRSLFNHLADEQRAYATIRESEHLKDHVRACLERWGRVARGEDPHLVPDHAYSIEVYRYVMGLTDWFGKLLRSIKEELPPEAVVSEQREIIGLIDQMGAVAAEIGTIAEVAEGIAAEAVDEETQALIDAEVKAIVAEREPTDQLAQRRAEHSQRRYEDLSEVQRRAAEVKRLAAGE